MRQEACCLSSLAYAARWHVPAGFQRLTSAALLALTGQVERKNGGRMRAEYDACLLNKNTFISILIYHLQGFSGKPQ